MLAEACANSPRSGMRSAEFKEARRRGGPLRPHRYSRTAPEDSGDPADTQRSHSFELARRRGLEAAKPLQAPQLTERGADVHRSARCEE